MDNTPNNDSSVPVTQPSQPSEQVVEHHPKNTNMVMLGIGALVILLLGLAGGYLLFSPKKTTRPPLTKTNPTTTPQPTTNPTANWKSYTNTKYNYSLNYPPNLNVADKYTNTKETAKTSSLIQFCECDLNNTVVGPGASDGPLVIEVSDLPNNETLSKFIKKEYPNLTQQTAYIDNSPAIRIDIPVGGNILIPGQAVFALHDSKVFIITWIKDPPYDDDKQIQLFNQILSTFQFTPLNSNFTPTRIITPTSKPSYSITNNASGEVMYTNTVYGFQLTMPSKTNFDKGASDEHWQRFRNYDDTTTIGSVPDNGGFLIELYPSSPDSCKNDVETNVSTTKQGSTTIYRGSAHPYGDAVGTPYILCAQQTNNYIKIAIYENKGGAIANPILSTFKLTQ